MRRVLLSEGSSLSARETITALGLAGQNVELLTSDPNCLGRYSRFVTAVHLAPASGSDSSGYLAAMLNVIRARRIEVLIPVHEQAYLFAARRDVIPADVGLALASFQSFEKVQSKEHLATLLAELEVPQPQTNMRTLLDLAARDQAFPFFVKTAFGTASEGVWRVENATQKRSLVAALARQGTKNVVVQSEVCGKLERAQTVFDHGRLVAFHTYRQLARGPGGGDVLKIGVARPDAVAHIEKIGAALQWHGALAFDYLLEDGTGLPFFIDANPRLVEPMNALSSGVDLAGALLAVSLGKKPTRQAAGRAGIVTRLGMMGLFDAAARRGRRMDVVREAMLLATGTGRYRGAIEELTPFASDRASAIPLTAVALRLLISPNSATQMTLDTVRNYCLTPETIGHLQKLHAAGADRGARIGATEPIAVRG